MLKIRETSFYGLPAQTLESAYLRLTYLIGEGPRVVGLHLPGEAHNFLAELPERSFDTPHGRYHLRGGHRLWTAPETWPISQLPDDQPVSVEALPEGVRLSGAVQPQTRLRKSLAVYLHPECAQARVVHRLENRGVKAIQVAAWGITMLPLGGAALLPQIPAEPGAAGLAPNRLLALWPYTRLDDPRLKLDDDLWQVHTGGKGRLKLGYRSQIGWAAYWSAGRLFVKRFPVEVGAALPDYGVNCEVYTDAYTLELESLGPLVILMPGGAVEHVETWECYRGADDPRLPADVLNALNRLTGET